MRLLALLKDVRASKCLCVQLKAVDVEFSAAVDVREVKSKHVVTGFSTDGEISQGRAVRVGRALQEVHQSWLEESTGAFVPCMLPLLRIVILLLFCVQTT